ncbi:MAG: hypothetical protein FJ318_09120 [SAR202 cluster bacterium]|nr:hypothetical protein [SAR202 cluster bacterium]
MPLTIYLADADDDALEIAPATHGVLMSIARDGPYPLLARLADYYASVDFDPTEAPRLLAETEALLAAWPSLRPRLQAALERFHERFVKLYEKPLDDDPGSPEKARVEARVRQSRDALARLRDGDVDGDPLASDLRATLDRLAALCRQAIATGGGIVAEAD